MTDRGILVGLTEKCQSDIRFFDFVELCYLGKKRKAFLCIGKHDVCFLKRKEFNFSLQGSLYYQYVDRFIQDSSNSTDMCIILTPDRPSDWKNDTIYIRSFQRHTLLQYLEIAWCTDRMFRFGRVHEFPIYIKKKLNADGWQDIKQVAPFVKIEPFYGFRQYTFNEFSFFLKKDFRGTLQYSIKCTELNCLSLDKASVTGLLDTGDYVDGRGFEVSIHVFESLPVKAISEIGQDSLTAMVAAYRQNITESMLEYNVILDQPYQKKMNLTDDPSFWMGWELFYETSQNWIMLIILRRNYFSCLMDLSQDIALIYRISLSSLTDNKISYETMVQECRLTANSITPLTQIHFCYRDLVQYKLDCLLFDETSFKWFQDCLKLKPRVYDKCLPLLKILLITLDKAGFLKHQDILYKFKEETMRSENPRALLNDIITSGEGFDPYCTHDIRQVIIFHQWQKRCARYLAFVLNGNTLENKFQLSDFVNTLGCLDSQTDKILKSVLLFLLHFRSTHWEEPYQEDFIFKMTYQTPPDSFLFNEEPVKLLLECNFLEKLFSNELRRQQEKKESEVFSDQYTDFLSLLLRSPNSFSLRQSLFQLIFNISGNKDVLPIYSETKKAFLMKLLPSLIYLVKSTFISPLACVTKIARAPFFTTLAIATLVTISAGNVVVKSLLLDSGIAGIIVEQIHIGNVEVQKYCVQLCINLTKTPLQRRRFTDAGLLLILVDLLVRNYQSTNNQIRSILYETAGVLGQLANESECRSELLTRFPTLDCVLFLFHTSTPCTHGRSRIIYCLRQCANESWYIRQRIGLHCLDTILHEFTYYDELSVSYVSRSLNLLLILADYKPNSFALSERSFETTMSKIYQKFDSRDIKEKSELLITRVNKNLKYSLR